MFNRNGNNGAHDGAAVASRNGNGHKPETAIPAEHDLLWDGLPPAVTQALGQPLDESLVSQRKGRGGRSFDYIEGHAVIDQANRIFGYGGWGYELVGDVTLRRVETVDSQTGEVKTSLGYSAPVRVTVAGALPRTDLGVHPVTEDNFDGHDTAMKAAVTDGMKRAFRSFGVQFGNAFYGDQPSASAPQAERVPVQANRNGRPSPRQVRSGPVQRQVGPGSGAAHDPERGAGREAAQAALRDRHGAGPQRGPGADRRHEPDGQEHRRPDGRRARAACGSRRQQAPADEAGAGPGGLACRSTGSSTSSGVVAFKGAAPLSIYRTRR